MDYDKLIERLRTDSLYADKASLEIMDLCMDAATAIETLRAEIEKLRAELGYEKEHANAYYEECGQWEAENKQLRAELAQADREGRCVIAPLKAGQTVYLASDTFGVEEETVERNIAVSETRSARVRAEDIGKTVFLTRQEAEAALRRKQDGRN